MADQFYTHRLTKMLEDFVLGSGMTIHMSDETSNVKLKEHIASIQAIAASVGAEATHKTEDGITIVRLRRTR